MDTPLVQCVFFKTLLPGLPDTPIDGDLGARLRANVSLQAWQVWIATERAYIKHFELDPKSPNYSARRSAVIQEFFFGPPANERLVMCVKFGHELPGLARPPFPGTLGMRIYNEVSQRAWALWPGQERLLINHYGLSLVDPQSQQVLMQAMEEFFFGDGAQLPEGWTPPQAPSKGGPRK